MIAVADNKIGREGAQALAGALKINKALVDVSLNRKSAHRTNSFCLNEPFSFDARKRNRRQRCRRVGGSVERERVGEKNQLGL